MSINVTQRNAGSTVKPTWINTGTVPGEISSALYSAEEVLVSSVTAIESGNGFYYALHVLPTSYANGGTHYWLVQEWRAVINGNPYYDRQFIRVGLPGVD